MAVKTVPESVGPNGGLHKLGVTKVGRAYRLAREGILPPGVVIRIGRRLLIDEDALDEFRRQGGRGLARVEAEPTEGPST